jgi:hypothetical protein
VKEIWVGKDVDAVDVDFGQDMAHSAIYRHGSDQAGAMAVAHVGGSIPIISQQSLEPLIKCHFYQQLH